MAAAIAVILPVYNGGDYLKLSVASVLAQTFANLELLIIDDCSTDDSYTWLQSLKDERITLYKNEKNQGLFYNLNFLIQTTNAPLIKLWAQDDVMYPHCVATSVDCHQMQPHIGFSYSGRDIINEIGKVIVSNPYDNTPAIISPALHAAIAYFTGSIAGNIANVCISNAALKKVGLFRTDFKISADFDMWVRLAQDHHTAFICDALIQLRDHKGQLSRNQSYYLLHAKEDLEVYRYLDSYASKSIKTAGHKMMQKHKLIFYYTLMVKALLGGRIKEGKAFYKLLSAYSNFLQLSLNFLLLKLHLKQTPAFNVGAWHENNTEAQQR